MTRTGRHIRVDLGRGGRWTPPRRVPAWIMSAGLHMTLLLAAALLVRIEPAQPPGSAVRPAGIALVHRNEGQIRYERHDEGDDRPNASNEAARSFPQWDDVPEGLGARLELPTAALPTGTSISLPRADGLGVGPLGPSRVAGTGARTNIFGAEGTGSSFVYVFDRSASMEGYRGRPMAAAKAQLIASLDDLGSVHQFQIIFYNERPEVFNPRHPLPPQMMFATEANRTAAREFIESITPAGGTRHRAAIEWALRLKPDVIFLLTDADEPQLLPRELTEIKRMNRRPTSINTIEFGAGPQQNNNNFLVQLARQNGGQHVYVDVSRLAQR